MKTMSRRNVFTAALALPAIGKTQDAPPTVEQQVNAILSCDDPPYPEFKQGFASVVAAFYDALQDPNLPERQ